MASLGHHELKSDTCMNQAAEYEYERKRASGVSIWNFVHKRYPQTAW